MHPRRRFLTASRKPAQSEGETLARKARIEPDCLALRGTVCRTCGEHCEPAAIRFRLLPGGRAIPLIDDALCDACGDCARACPVRAIALQPAAPAAA